MNDKQVLESLEEHLSFLLYDIECELSREAHLESVEIRRSLYALTPTNNVEKHTYAQEKIKSMRLRSRVQAALTFIRNNKE